MTTPEDRKRESVRLRVVCAALLMVREDGRAELAQWTRVVNAEAYPAAWRSA